MILNTKVSADCNIASALRGPDNTDKVSQALKSMVTARIRFYAECNVGAVRDFPLAEDKLQDILDSASGIERCQIVAMHHYLTHAKWGIAALIERFAERDTSALEALERFVTCAGLYFGWLLRPAVEPEYHEAITELKAAWTALVSAEEREEELGWTKDQMRQEP